MRFDEQSFTKEITNKAEALNCYHYLIQNLGELQKELIESGASYEAVNVYVRRLWQNLTDACTRVGYTNAHIEAAKQALAESAH